MLVDVSIDQGGCFETSRPTTHSDPTYEVDGDHPLLRREHARRGADHVDLRAHQRHAAVRAGARRARRREAIERDPGLRSGVNVADGRVTHPAVAQGSRDGLHPCRAGCLRRHQWRPSRSTKIRNFIGGEERDPAERRDRGDPQPGHRGGDRRRADVGRGGRRRRRRGRAARRSTAGRRRTPRERAEALLRIADAIEENAEELARIESLNVGKPYQTTLEEELPVVVDNLRFFAGAARVMEGKAAGEYMEGYTSMMRREAVGVVGQIAPWNYPLMMAGLEDRPGAGDRQHRRAEAVRADADDRGAAGADLRRAPAARRAERDLRPRRAGRRRARPPPGRGDGVADRRRGHRQGDRPHGGRHAQARAPGAGRQGAGRGVRRRRRRGGDRGRQDRRLLQRRAGLHGGVARARRAEDLRRLRVRAGRRGVGR